MLKHSLVATFIAIASSFAFLGCSTAPKSDTAKEDLSNDAQTELNRLKRDDSSLESFLNNAHAYAIFPSVGKGGVGIGGAYGHGVVYQGGQLIGYADLRQATVGLQLGGQTYTELLAFENKEALDRFKSNSFAFSANASAVAIKSGSVSPVVAVSLESSSVPVGSLARPLWVIPVLSG